MPYKSIYSSPEKKTVTAAQYISELVCFNNATKNKQELPLNFWRVPHWRQYYIVQIKNANRLLESYDEAIIIKFVRESRIWSLSAKWILAKLTELQNKKSNREFKIVEVKERPTFQTKKPIDIDYLDG